MAGVLKNICQPIVQRRVLEVSAGKCELNDRRFNFFTLKEDHGKEKAQQETS
jgi:hypothetical protein